MLGNDRFNWGHFWYILSGRWELTVCVLVGMNLNYDNAVVAQGKADDKGVDLYNIFRKIQHRAVVCTSNLGDGGNETIVRGLVCGHAYSLLQLDEVELDDGSTERIGE